MYSLNSTKLPTIKTDYLQEFLLPASFERLIDQAAAVLSKYEFDAIAFRGVSGALCAIPLSLRLQKPLLIVRKEDGAHSSVSVEGITELERYVIVDEFKETGGTVAAIIDKVSATRGSHVECVGLLLLKWMCSPYERHPEYRIPGDGIVTQSRSIPNLYFNLDTKEGSSSDGTNNATA